MSQPKPHNLSAPPHLRLRIVFDDARYLGPGKVDLLEGIARTGSIAAAGREMGMSYKRAWDLTHVMNTMFAAPLISSARGGAGGGGAQLTDLGVEVLALYRQIQIAAEHAGAGALAQLHARLAPVSAPK